MKAEVSPEASRLRLRLICSSELKELKYIEILCVYIYICNIINHLFQLLAKTCLVKHQNLPGFASISQLPGQLLASHPSEQTPPETPGAPRGSSPIRRIQPSRSPSRAPWRVIWSFEPGPRSDASGFGGSFAQSEYDGIFHYILQNCRRT